MSRQMSNAQNTVTSCPMALGRLYREHCTAPLHSPEVERRHLCGGVRSESGGSVQGQSASDDRARAAASSVGVTERGMPFAHVARTLGILPPGYAPAWPVGLICYEAVIFAAPR